MIRSKSVGTFASYSAGVIVTPDFRFKLFQQPFEEIIAVGHEQHRQRLGRRYDDLGGMSSAARQSPPVPFLLHANHSSGGEIERKLDAVARAQS